MVLSKGLISFLVCLNLGDTLARGTADRFYSLTPDPQWRKTSYDPGCWLGHEHYNLKEKFSPPMEPHGRLTCLICQCIPVIKKSIIQQYGKVKCVNIKDRCPIPNCHDPVLLPGKCCKSCIGEVETFEDRFSLLPDTLPKELNTPTNSDRLTHIYAKSREYTAVLVGRQVPSKTPVFTRAVAVVRLKVTSSGGLQFYVKHTYLNRPRLIRLTDLNGNVLLEKSLLHNGRLDNMFCGEWHKVPFYYLRYLSQGRLLIIITTVSYPNGEIAGIPEINRLGSYGTFGALLVSPTPDGIGAYAELTYNIRSKSIGYVIKYNGLFVDKRNKRRRQEYFVTIERRTKIVHEATRRSKLRKNRLKGLWRKIDRKSRRLIARNRLRMRVTSKGGTTMIGEIQPITTCETYQAVLSNGEALVNTKRPVSSMGSAVFYLHENGDVQYKIELRGMTSPVTSITIETSQQGRLGKRRIVGNIIKNFHRNTSSFDGIARGILTKPNAKEIAMLLSEKLFVNIATVDRPVSLLRGRIELLPYSEILQPFTDKPFMLMSPVYAPTGVAGHAWLSTDDHCVLHYLIALSGLRDYTTITALLSGKYSSSNNDIYTIIISNFVNGKAYGSISDLSEEVFLNLASGIAVLHIDVKGIIKGEVMTTLSIANKCWQMVRDQDPGVIVDENGNIIAEEDEHICKYEGNLYRDGDSWIPEGNFTCSTCSCKRGKIICHRVICPTLKCKEKQIITGDCCPVCTDIPKLSVVDTPLVRNESKAEQEINDELCFYNGDKRYYKPGSFWHPYVPPFGYSKCAICTCTRSKEVNCSRLPCPKLTCLPHEAVRLNNSDCCPVCPNNVLTSTSTPLPKQADTDTNGACHFGGKIYDDKSRWIPEVSPFGKINCFVCRCKNSNVRCKKKRCKNCKLQSKRQNSCCSQCSAMKRVGKGRRRRKQSP